MQRNMLAVMLLPTCAAYQLAGARPVVRAVAPMASRTAPVGPVMNSEEDGIRSGLIGIDTEVPFEVRFSLGNLITGSGLTLLIYSVVAFLLNNGESSLVQTLGFVYGIPASLGGAALKYAELPPVPVATTPQATAAREKLATKVQAKIFSDATRFCYGDAHMEEPLKALKFAPPGRGPPELRQFTESVSPEGGYAMGMTFFAPYTPYTVWKARGKKYAGFFGPNIRAELRKVSSEKRLVELTLITTKDGESTEPQERLADGTLIPLTIEVPDVKAEEAPAQATV
jgi:hypothetical protein|tara:strand:- start:113 stop:964 length:852 start_codon:yes stop_codon:yes gene_type:complete